MKKGQLYTPGLYIYFISIYLGKDKSYHKTAVSKYVHAKIDSYLKHFTIFVLCQVCISDITTMHLYVNSHETFKQS